MDTDRNGFASEINVERCIFEAVNCPVYAEGSLRKLCLVGNESDSALLCLLAQTEDFINEENSWNVN